MKAMVFAAGLGTRLRPLTDDRPKALVEINGRTLLEITLSRLRAFGIREVMINIHHCADMIVQYLEANANFGMHVEVSREDVLLDTGGALKKAADFFLDDSARLDEPFVVHNVDVLSTTDLARMVQFHLENEALATLAVQQRKTSRYLLFNRLSDKRLQLFRRRSGDGEAEHAEPGFFQSGMQHQALAFCGIHVISPRLLNMMTEDGVFSIINTYLRLADQGERILGFSADAYYWRDLGKPENVAQAARDLDEKIISL